MELDLIVDAINEHQYSIGEESGYQKSQFRYTEIAETGESFISVESRAYSNDSKGIEFSVITEKGKILSINEI